MTLEEDQRPRTHLTPPKHFARFVEWCIAAGIGYALFRESDVAPIPFVAAFVVLFLATQWLSRRRRVLAMALVSLTWLAIELVLLCDGITGTMSAGGGTESQIKDRWRRLADECIAEHPYMSIPDCEIVEGRVLVETDFYAWAWQPTRIDEAREAFSDLTFEFWYGAPMSELLEPAHPEGDVQD